MALEKCKNPSKGNIEGVHQEINDLKGDNTVLNQKLSDQHSKLTNQNILFDEIDGKINILNTTLSKKIAKEHLESSQRDQDKIEDTSPLSFKFWTFMILMIDNRCSS